MPHSMDEIFFSADRKQELETELKRLQSDERSKVAKEIEVAKSHGDLSENAEYHAARERQAKVEDRIREIEYILKTGKVTQSSDTSQVSVGHTVVVNNKTTDKNQTYTIVGLEEQDITAGKISNQSPIAKALLGKSVGDTASFESPRGIMELEIISITN